MRVPCLPIYTRDTAYLQLPQHAAQVLAGGGGLRGVLVAHEAADERGALLRAQRVEHAVEY